MDWWSGSWGPGELGVVSLRAALDVLIVTRPDRLARSTRDLLNILHTLGERSIGFKSLADAWADTTTDGQTLAAQDAALHAAGCTKVYGEKHSRNPRVAVDCHFRSPFDSMQDFFLICEQTQSSFVACRSQIEQCAPVEPEGEPQEAFQCPLPPAADICAPRLTAGMCQELP
jgi:hypothetical protein